MTKDVELLKVEPAAPVPGRKPMLDVIFIHGLGGDHVETWKPPLGDAWPQRVANAHPDVQVWALSYPAKVGQLLSIGEVDQPGTRGLSVLATERMITKKVGERRPCIFVCHSLGGLLVKRILLDAWAADPRNERRFRHEGVKAVMFCGTPHRGSAIATVLKSMEWVKNMAPGIVMTYLGWDHARFSGVAARCLGRTSELIKELEQNNVELQHLNEDFGRYYQDRAGSDFMVSVYAETKGMRVKGVPTAVVVPAESADPNLRTGAGVRLNVVAVPDKDHSELVKPASMSEWVVEGVDDLIGRALGKLLSNRTMQRARGIDEGKASSDPPQRKTWLENSLQAGDRTDVLDENENGMSVSLAVRLTGRQVFICHAANDPQWVDEEVERFADVVRQAGLAVRLDIWHKRDSKRDLSPDEWRVWMKDSLNTSTNIVCLISPKYRRLWDRKESDTGGFGVAYEAIRLVHALYLRKQHNAGWILTLRQDGGGFDVIPDDLAPDCVHYQWRSDLEIVVSHLAHAELYAAHAMHSDQPGRDKSGAMGEDGGGVVRGSSVPGSASGQALSSSDHCRKTQRLTLDHQAQCAIERLEKAPVFWTALRASRDFMDWCGNEKLASPRSFVNALLDWSPDDVAKIMWGLCDIYKSMQGRQSELDEKVVASATVACIVVCACRTIELRSAGLLARLPEVSDLEAAKLLCGLIALVMRGGRLELVVGNGDYPVARNTFEVQAIDQSQGASFKRQLLREVVKKSSSHHEALKAGDLSEVAENHLDSQIKARIDWARGFGSNRSTACVVVLSGDLPDESVLKFIAEFDLPMFHLSADAVHDVTGMNEEYLAECLKIFWADVSSCMRQERAQGQALQSHLVDLIKTLTALAESQSSNPISSEIHALADSFRKSAEGQQAPSRDLLDRWNGLAGKLNQFGDESQKLVDRLGPQFRFVYSLF